MKWLLQLLLFIPIIFTSFYSNAEANSPTMENKLGEMLDNKYQLNTEAQLDNNYSPEINEFWDKHAQVYSFESTNGGTIHTIHITTGQKNAVVISQGRNESVLKYKEFAFDLSKQGYDVFLIDHRGQGFSSRLGGDAHRGHVEDFQHYVIDLKTFIDSLQLDKHYQYRFLLSHSMGGTINALYLEEQSHPFQAAAFFSPMFSINLGGLPAFIAKIISYISDLLCRWFSDLACYAPGVGPYKATSFEKNELTNSTKRYASAFHFFEVAKETQLGGATMRWVNQSLYATEKAIDSASLIKIPVIIIQSGADSIVTAEGQQAFLENSAQCAASKLVTIAGAKHELLLEQDIYRIPAITAVLDFFQQYQKGKLACIK
ncbi:alpha/beta fold hydrolase [Psychromonas sp. RZ22]|uniref:alpha/beta fold hydrolase n=1 Tax=Psychromonas algarum TaxID=2555643 RepID=UPI00106891C0|nr:alpha/beta fold hydrolase [Psychromonas sp. RZ22]TEW54560.1 alpha/beta fold hydrolase [Psychromonas sp. RZ22]